MVMKTDKTGYVTILAISIAVIGVIAPILWDKYKSTSALELQCLSKISIDQSSQPFEKLQFFYDGKQINCISKIDFALINVGRTPIQHSHLVQPINLVFPPFVDLLEVKVEEKCPNNIDFSHNIDTMKESVSLDFSLLNPSDFVRFSVIVAGKMPVFSAQARIVNVKSIKVVDRTAIISNRSPFYSWVFWLVGIGTAFTLLLIMIGFVPDLLKARKWERALQDNGFKIPAENASEFRTFVQNDLSFLIEEERKSLIALRMSFQQDESITNDQSKELRSKIMDIIQSDKNLDIGVVVILSILAIIGLAYTIYSIV
jgi:hypothetical protein